MIILIIEMIIDSTNRSNSMLDIEYIITEYDRSIERPFIITKRLNIELSDLMLLICYGYDIVYEYIEELLIEYNERTIHYLQDYYILPFIKLLPYNYHIHYTIPLSYNRSIIEALIYKNIRVTIDASSTSRYKMSNIKIARLASLTQSVIIDSSQYTLAQMLIYLQVPFTTISNARSSDVINITMHGVQLIPSLIVTDLRNYDKAIEREVDMEVIANYSGTMGESTMFTINKFYRNIESLLLQSIVKPQSLTSEIKLSNVIFNESERLAVDLILTLHNQGLIRMEEYVTISSKLEKLMNIPIVGLRPSKNARRL